MTTRAPPRAPPRAPATRRDFRELVNMPPARLEKWLDGKASRGAGQKRNGARESTGHASGRRIVAIRRKRVTQLTVGDLTHMRKVIGTIRRHLAQRPRGDVTETRWRHSLMNWGHDPLR